MLGAEELKEIKGLLKRGAIKEDIGEMVILESCLDDREGKGLVLEVQVEVKRGDFFGDCGEEFGDCNGSVVCLGFRRKSLA